MIWAVLLTLLGALPPISASCYRPTGPIFRWRSINGPPVNGKYPEGTKFFFECELGFGSRIIYYPSVYQANGQWTQTSGCEVTCPPLRHGNGLTYNTSFLYDELYLRRRYSVSTKVSFPCNDFDYREGSSSLICQRSGNWGQQAPICNKTCDEPVIPANGSLHSTSRSRYPNGKYPQRTEAIFQYQTGNETTFQHSFCQYGNWTELISLYAKCDDPTDPGNRRRAYAIYEPLVNGKYREGSKVYYVCELGFGSRELYHPSVCQANGEWTQFRCEVICPPLNIINGEAAYNTSELYDKEYDRRGYSVGTMSSFSCDGEESGSVICQSSGNWSQPGPTCIAIPCLRPTVDNGYYLIFNHSKPFTDGVFYEYTLLEFHCDPGYTLIDSIDSLNTSLCLLNGTWHPPVPRCNLQEV